MHASTMKSHRKNPFTDFSMRNLYKYSWQTESKFIKKKKITIINTYACGAKAPFTYMQWHTRKNTHTSFKMVAFIIYFVLREKRLIPFLYRSLFFAFFEFCLLFIFLFVALPSQNLSTSITEVFFKKKILMRHINYHARLICQQKLIGKLLNHTEKEKRKTKRRV